jgi:O-antigen/teichoic acid export membrane protein
MLALLLVAATVRVGDIELLPWAVLAMVMWQGQETMRRTLLAKLRHRDAIWGDAVSFLGQAACIWLFWKWGTLTPQWALGGIAATSALALLIQFAQIMAGRPSATATLPTLPEPAAESFKTDAIRWWYAGRWLVVTYLVNIGTVYLTPWVLEAARGETTVASFYALTTLMNLANPVLFSLAGLLMAAVAAAGSGAACRLDAFNHGWHIAVRYTSMGLILILPYYVLVLCAPQFMLTVFFKATSPYVALQTELRYMVPMYAAFFLAQMTVALLNGLGEARGSFVATLSSSITAVVIVVPVTFRWGLQGALIAGILPMLVQLVVALWMLRRFSLRASNGSAPAIH